MRVRGAHVRSVLSRRLVLMHGIVPLYRKVACRQVVCKGVLCRLRCIRMAAQRVVVVAAADAVVVVGMVVAVVVTVIATMFVVVSVQGRGYSVELQYNDRGYRIGQSHHKARLTDRDVELIFELREQGMTIVSIAERMECGRTTVWKILHGEIRSQPVVKSRCVHVLPWAM